MLAAARDFDQTDQLRLHDGSHHRLYEVLGAHPLPAGNGFRFTVWAPRARSVSVLGDFNGWDPQRHPMHRIPTAGVWTADVPEAEPGHRYKFHLRRRWPRRACDKADPLSFQTETPPATASVIGVSEHDWGDQLWLAARRERDARRAPMSVYEVHLGSWRRGPSGGHLSYREIAPLLAEHASEYGFTHVELLPVMEHPFYGSWGYQVTSYFAPTARYGSPDELRYLIDHLHQRDIGVILDWVPSHFPSDEFALGRFDGRPLYEHPDPQRGWHPDWGSLIFDYGRAEVLSFLLSSAAWWLDSFHADGLRVDAVASMLYLDFSRKTGEWTPNRHGGREHLEAAVFLRRLNMLIASDFPGVTIHAEESSTWPGLTRPVEEGGLGFSFKWDMGWMNDTLAYMRKGADERATAHGELTFRSDYQYAEAFLLPLSHDEVVYGKGSLLGKMPGSGRGRFDDLRLLLGYQWALPGKKLLFMGSEIAEVAEWDHDGEVDWSLLTDPLHQGVAAWVAALNRLYCGEPVLHRGDCDGAGFRWVAADDAAGSTLAFLRLGGDGDRSVLVVANFSDREHVGYEVDVTHPGPWQVLLRSDDPAWGGTGKEPTALEIHSTDEGGSPRIRFDLSPRTILFLA